LFRFEIRIGFRLRAIAVLLPVASRGAFLHPGGLALCTGRALLLVGGPLLGFRRALLRPLRPATHRRPRRRRVLAAFRAMRLRCGKVRPALAMRAALRLVLPLRRIDR
jgi:hypothetical protein